MNFLTNFTEYEIIITNETFRDNLQHDLQYPIYEISEPLHVKLLGRFKGTRYNTRGHQAETKAYKQPTSHHPLSPISDALHNRQEICYKLHHNSFRYIFNLTDSQNLFLMV